MRCGGDSSPSATAADMAISQCVPPASSSALGPQVRPVPPVSPSSPATAQLSPSTGRVGTLAKGPSPDTSSKRVLQVSQLLSASHPHLDAGGALGSGERETEAGSADLSQATQRLGIRTWVFGVVAMMLQQARLVYIGERVGVCTPRQRGTSLSPWGVPQGWSSRSQAPSLFQTRGSGTSSSKTSPRR